jgi:hypothetical protein
MLRVKITNVDMHGFQGRMYHPLAKHVGQVVRVLEMHTEYEDDHYFMEAKSADEVFFLQGPEYVLALAKAFEDGMHLIDATESKGKGYQTFIAITDDGEPLELMDHEVELVALAPEQP